MKLNAKELRDVPEEAIQEQLKHIRRQPLYLILENVYDTYNIGGLFRLADALAVSRIYLCGEMETPPNGRIAKASIGTYKVVPWVYKETARDAIDELKQTVKGIQTIAVEQDERSKPYTDIPIAMPVALLVGNETFGVTRETLDAVDYIAEIPMWGINKSLNVIVSAAIVSYYVVSSTKK